MSRHAQIQARRRITMRAGLAAILAITALTACIFDQGNYQGGGRKDNGGSSQSATATATDTTPTSTATTDQDAGDQDQYVPFVDAADANGG